MLDQDRYDKLYLPRDIIMKFATTAVNAQDGILLALLHDGFSHKKKVNLIKSYISYSKQ